MRPVTDEIPTELFEFTACDTCAISYTVVYQYLCLSVCELSWGTIIMYMKSQSYIYLCFKLIHLLQQ